MYRTQLVNVLSARVQNCRTTPRVNMTTTRDQSRSQFPDRPLQSYNFFASGPIAPKNSLRSVSDLAKCACAHVLDDNNLQTRATVNTCYTHGGQWVDCCVHISNFTRASLTPSKKKFSKACRLKTHSRIPAEVLQSCLSLSFENAVHSSPKKKPSCNIALLAALRASC